jgi:hypothetical protein
MRETHDHPLVGDVIVRTISDQYGALVQPGSYAVSVFPLRVPARRTFQDLDSAIEFACTAAEKNGGIQVWRESDSRPGQYQRISKREPPIV